MNMMVTEMYDALISAGAEEVKARAAAETLASGYQKTDQQFSELREDNQKLRTEMAGIRGEMTLLRWMMGLIIATNIAIIFRIFSS